MKSLGLAFALTVSLLLAPARGQSPTPAPAPSARTAALAEELLSLFQLDKTMAGAFDQMLQMQSKMSEGSKMSPAERASMQKSTAAAMGEMKNAFRWDVIKPTFIEIYAEVFTADELQGMIEFFKSPVGQKWIAKQPQLQAATMQRMQALIMDMQPKIQEAIKKAAAGESKAE